MIKSNLRGTAALQVVALLGAGLTLATPAFAQTTPTTPPPTTNQATTDSETPKPATNATTQEEVAEEGGTIVVTGSILRRTTTETPSPVTIVTADSLEQRGTNTIQEGIQNLSSNNGPALTNSFSANGAFAAGASAVSLRGLSTNSTLVLFDGLRAAYYPLADDGSRNFVDLNTVPDDIVERVEILRDGASSSYGADAIAGVVNIITKREFQGIQARAEAGISSRGDAGQRRLSLTAGVGDLADKGYNAYISGFYYKSKALRNSQRGFPYNTDDLQTLCNNGVCGGQGVFNGLNNDTGLLDFYTAGGVGITARPGNGGVAVPNSQFLTGDCGRQPTYTVTAADRANRGGGAVANGAILPNTACVTDFTKDYAFITPDIRRFGVSARGTFALSDVIEAYTEVNFLQSNVSYDGYPNLVRNNAPTGIFNPRFSTALTGGAFAPGSGQIFLPIYVCPRGTTYACVAGAPGATLSTVNPFASQNQTAVLFGRIQTIPHLETRNRAYRGALGVKGTFLGDWGFGVNATAMHVDLQRTQNGYIYIQRLLDVVRDGSYDFLNPANNTQADEDYLTPGNRTNATSDLYQVDATVQKDLFQLPGGPVQLGVGVSARYEAVDAPSGNSDAGGPTQRYFVLNAFGTSGSRRVYSAYGELNAPILDQLEVNVSGRYDKYSSGQKNFSPKVGVKFTPIRELALRGTYSKGFRIPSFGEANALPTTGFVSANAGIYNNATLNQYGCSTATFNSCPLYIRSTSYGLTTLASPNLAPEKSRSFTFGAIFEPIRNWAMTFDYYDIKKTGAITNPETASSIIAYYAGNTAGINPAVTIVPDAPDPSFPNARPRIGFVQSQLINANTNRSRGIDFAVAGQSRLFGVKWNTALEASYIIELSTTTAGGTEQYAGTLGNYNLTAGSGTPRWKGSWQNTLDFGKLALTGVANFFGGYNLSAEDQTGPNTAGECGLSDGIIPCDVKSYLTFDATAQFKLNDQFTLTGTVLNIADKMPPLDTVTYGAHLYNPVQGGLGILGRYFRAGVKVNF